MKIPALFWWNHLESIQTKQCDRYFDYVDVTALYHVRAIAYNKGGMTTGF
jgi:hypothetical protein